MVLAIDNGKARPGYRWRYQKAGNLSERQSKGRLAATARCLAAICPLCRGLFLFCYVLQLCKQTNIKLPSFTLWVLNILSQKQKVTKTPVNRLAFVPAAHSEQPSLALLHQLTSGSAICFLCVSIDFLLASRFELNVTHFLILSWPLNSDCNCLISDGAEHLISSNVEILNFTTSKHKDIWK